MDKQERLRKVFQEKSEQKNEYRRNRLNSEKDKAAYDAKKKEGMHNKENVERNLEGTISKRIQEKFDLLYQQEYHQPKIGGAPPPRSKEKLLNIATQDIQRQDSKVIQDIEKENRQYSGKVYHRY